MKDINFEQYKVFYYVAKNLSFSKASKELFVSQSAVSQSIKNLENRLNTPLFLRQSKKISLTTQGKLLFDNVQIGFSYIENGEKNINITNNINEIRLAASDTTCKYFLLPYIEKYNTLYPDVKITILNKPSNDCLVFLKNFDVDVAFINSPKNISDDLVLAKNIKEVSDVFIAGPKYHKLKDKKFDIKEILQYPILTLEKSSSTRSNFDNFLKTHNLHQTPEIEVQSMGLLKDLTRIGLGFSYITSLAISKSSDLFTLNITEQMPKSCIYLSTLKMQKYSETVTNFLNLFA